MLRTLALALALLVGCSASGLSGKYLTSPGGSYGWEFDGDTVYSLLGVGDAMGRGTYTVEDGSVRVCIGSRCVDMQMVDGCLVQAPGGRYCKEWPQPAREPVPNPELAGLSCGELRVVTATAEDVGERLGAYIEQTIRCGIASPAP